MPFSDLCAIAEATINSIQPTGTLTEECVEKLRILFPEPLLLAALDLVDREHVIKYITPWGRTHYEVIGSTATYTVFPSLMSASPVLAYCTCPSFPYAVLLQESHIMCKHVLAVHLAQRMCRCIERHVDEDDLASVIARELYTDVG